MPQCSPSHFPSMTGSGVERISEARRTTKLLTDQPHRNGELLAAAMCYIVAGAGDNAAVLDPTSDLTLMMWPFGDEDWLPSTDTLANLAQAGAYIAAEVDRLLAGENEALPADPLSAPATS